MKSVYVYGISLAISIAILYLLWQQKKKMDEMSKLITSIQVPQQSSIDREFILNENQRLHKKIEDSYGHIHEQYQQVLIAVDNIPIIGANINYSVEDDDTDNIPSYHGEDLINIANDEHIVPNYSLENSNNPKDSIMGVENQSLSSRIENVEKTPEISTDKLKSISKSIKDVSKSKSVKETSIQSSVNSYGNYPKIVELKNLCKERGLNVSGNKTELVQRLLNNGYIF